jgi:hypothetical protein
LKGKELCLFTHECTWVFPPGAHTYYSSTNFVLAGLILLNHAPEGQQTWETFKLAPMLGLDTENDYKNTIFTPVGTLKDIGLTAPGASVQYGLAELWE